MPAGAVPESGNIAAAAKLTIPGWTDRACGSLMARRFSSTLCQERRINMELHDGHWVCALPLLILPS
jgi:hypothetical protein